MNKQKVGDLMSRDVIALDEAASMRDAAKTMSDRNVGCVIVVKSGGGLCGVVTDRDLVVRGLAKGLDAATTPVGEVCSHFVAQVEPDDDIDQAISLMREKAVRRVPVMGAAGPVGILSLGDLALERDPKSALGAISGAPANH